MGIIQRQVILAKIESTYNTDPTPTNTDNAILVENVQSGHDGVRMIERPAVRPSIGSLPQVYAGRLGTISFDVEVKGSGTAGTAPEYGPLLRACGIAETIVAVTSVSYKPASTSHESVTIYCYMDGRLVKYTGCRGNVSFAAEAGTRGLLSFSMTGHISLVTDASLPAPTLQSTIPVPFINASFAADSYAAIISAFNFDLSNTLVTPPNPNATDGYAEIRITKRDVNGSFDPEATVVATYNWITKWVSGATYALATGTIGSTAGNRWALSMPAIQYREVSHGDRDGIFTHDVAFGACESSGDDEFTLLFTQDIYEIKNSIHS